MAKTEFHGPGYEDDDDGPKHFKQLTLRASAEQVFMRVDALTNDQGEWRVVIDGISGRRYCTVEVVNDIIDALQKAIDFVELKEL